MTSLWLYFRPLSLALADLAPALKNHLWQSTLFALVAALLTLALRRNHARARYWLWLAASLKFLVPFSLLIGLGNHLATPRAAATAPAAVYFAMEEVSQPFTLPETPVAVPALSPRPTTDVLPIVFASIWLIGFAAVLTTWFVYWRRIAAVMRAAIPLREGRELEMLRRLESAACLGTSIEFLASPSNLGPGIYGIRRPILIWPAAISQRLDDAHLESVLAHEICHVRRRDNLTAALHMLVEAIFWFHPIVWWLGARLEAERERACDEFVLEATASIGTQPHIYAESILKVCEFYVESPLPCVSGVTGADLKKRILDILDRHAIPSLSFGKKLLVAVIGLVVVVVPILSGQAKAVQHLSSFVLTPPPLDLPSFLAASEPQTGDQSGTQADASKAADLLYVDVPPAEPQILLKVRFASYNRGLARQLGVNLFSLGAAYSSGPVTTQQPSPPAIPCTPGTPGIAAPPTSATTSSPLDLFIFRPEVNLGATIEALQANQVMQVLSEPTLLTANGKKGSLLAGGQYPFPVGATGAGGCAITIQFREFGVRLNFIPTITARGSIRLQVAPEVSSLDFANGVTTSGFTVPGLDVRQAKTEVELSQGQSFAIGGLLDSRSAGNFSKMPSLGDIPVLGRFFQSVNASKSDSELIVIVTPEMVQPVGAGSPATKLSSPALPTSAALIPVAFGQEKANSAKGKAWTFDVVSIRQNKTEEGPQHFGATPDGFRAINLPLIGLFQIAYVPTGTGDSGFFRGSRISGAPDWLTRTERFDVMAKVADADLAEWQKPASRPAMLRAMMRALLEERLKASTHIENKEVPVFDLMVLKGGPKFKVAEMANITELRAKHPGAIVAPDGAVVSPGSSMRQMNFFAASMGTMTPLLSYLAERPVLDKTGLTGRYDFTTQMSFNLLGPALDNATARAGTPVTILPPPAPPPGTQGGGDVAPENSEPSVFAVVQELGLKLEPAKGFVETLVIDHVERPAEN